MTMVSRWRVHDSIIVNKHGDELSAQSRVVGRGTVPLAPGRRNSRPRGATLRGSRGCGIVEYDHMEIKDDCVLTMFI